MDKKHRELRKNVEYYYNAIKYAQECLDNIREKQCKHPKIEKGNYMVRPGQIIENTDICSVCGKLFLTNEL